MAEPAWLTKFKEAARTGEKSGEASKKFEKDARKEAAGSAGRAAVAPVNIAEKAAQEGGRRAAPYLAPFLKPLVAGSKVVQQASSDAARAIGGAVTERAGKEIGNEAGRSPVIMPAAKLLRKNLDAQNALSDKIRGALGAGAKRTWPALAGGSPSGAIGAGAGGSASAPDGMGTDETSSDVDPNSLAGAASQGPAAPAPAATGGGGGYVPPTMAEMDTLGPQQRAALEAARAAEAGRIGESERRHDEQALLEEASAFDHQRKLQAQDEGVARAEAARAAEAKQRQAAFDSASKELAQAKFVDPWEQKSVPEKGLAILGLIIGGIGAGMGRGPNLALQVIDRQIDREMDRQKAQFAALKDKAGAAQTAYGMAMQRFGDERAADAVTRASLREGYGAEMQRLAAKSSSVKAADAVGQARVALDERIAQDKIQFLKFAPVGGSGGGGGAAPAKTPEGLLFDAKPDELVDLGDGTAMAVRGGAATAAKIREARAADAKITKIQDRAIELLKKNHPAQLLNPLSEVGKEWASLQETGIPLQSTSTGQGIVHEVERPHQLKSMGLDLGKFDAVTKSREALIKRIEAAKKNRPGSQQLLDANKGPVVKTQYELDKTGKRAEFADADAASQALGSGMVAPQKTADVPVRSPDGKVGTVKGADLEAAIAQGYSLATGRQHRIASYEAPVALPEPIKQLSSFLMNQGVSASKGLTAGLSDIAVSKGIDEAQKLFGHKYGGALGNRIHATKEYIRDYRAEHEVASGIAEAGGAIGGALAGGAIGSAGKAGAAAKLIPSAGIDALGAGVEGAVARGLGSAGTSVLGKAAVTGTKLAARAGIESAIYAAGNEAGEEALGDSDLNAQKIFAAGLHAGVTGAVVGGGLGFAGSLASQGVKALARGAAPKLEKLASDQAWKSLDPLKKFSEQANARAGGTEAVGSTLRKYKVPSFGADLEAMVPRIDAAVEEVGQKIGAITEQSGGKVSASKLYDAIDAVVAPSRAKAGHEGIANALDDYTLSLFEKLGATKVDDAGRMIVNREAQIPVQQVLAQRKALDELVYLEQKSLDPKLRVAKMREIRGGIEEQVLSSIDDAAKAQGSATTRKELEALKRDYQHLRIAQDAAESSTSRMATNRNLSMSDYQTMIAGAATGHLALAPIGAVANNMLRARGNATASVVADKLAGLGAVKRAVEQTDVMVDRAVRSIAGREAKKDRPPIAKAKPRSPEPLEERYRAAREHVAAIASDPVAWTDRAMAQSESISDHTPNTKAAYAATMARSAAYLQGILPKDSSPRGLLSDDPGQLPSHAEMHAFLEKYTAATNQKETFADIANGKVTREALDALREVSPGLHAELQEKAVTMVTEEKAKGTPMPYAQRVRLATLLDVPTDATLAPENVAKLQAPFSGQAPADGGGSAPRGASKSSGPSPLVPPPSSLDRIASGGPGR